MRRMKPCQDRHVRQLQVLVSQLSHSKRSPQPHLLRINQPQRLYMELSSQEGPSGKANRIHLPAARGSTSRPMSIDCRNSLIDHSQEVILIKPILSFIVFVQLLILFCFLGCKYELLKLQPQQALAGYQIPHFHHPGRIHLPTWP